MSIWAILCVAIGGALLFEGIGWAVVPGTMKSAYQRMLAEASERDLHIMGVIAVGLGMLLLLGGAKILAGA